MLVIFFLTNYNYILVYHEYVQAHKDKYEEKIYVMVESTFYNTWKILMPSLQFIFSKSDLYEIYETIKLNIQYTMNYKKKLAVTKNYLAYLNRVKKEHDYYNINIKNTIKDRKHNWNTIES